MIVILNQFYAFLKNVFITLKPSSFKTLLSKSYDNSKSLYQNFCLELSSISKKVRNLVNTNIELGLYHFYKGNNDDAYLRFRLIKICTSRVDAIACYNLGRCCFFRKNFKKAQKYLTKALESKEYYPEATYYLAKINNPQNIAEIPIGFLEEKFDSIASYYVKEIIIEKGYRGYKIILCEIIDYLHEKCSQSNILDVGCGTGICGHFLKMNNIGHCITGIDVSAHMLNVAERCYVEGKAAYDKLIHTSSSKYFSDIQEKFDIILAIDSLGWEKESYNTFCLYRDNLKKGGMIIAIVRSSESQEIEFNSDLDMFCYSQDHMLQLASQLDMAALKVIKCQLYSDVDGYLCMFIKK